MTRSSLSRRERRQRRKAERPTGSRRALFTDPQAFAIAVWSAFREIGLGPTIAAELTTTLIESDSPITLEYVEGALVMASAQYDGKTTTLARHADRLSRKAREVLERADERERNWLIEASGTVRALVHFAAEEDRAGVNRCLGILLDIGWRPVIERLQRRFEAAARSNLPPFEGRLSAAARRLVNTVRNNAAKNASTPSALQEN